MKYWIIGAVLVVLVGSGVYFYSVSNQSAKDDVMMKKTDEAMMHKDDTMMKKDTMASTSDAMMKDDAMMPH